MSFPPELSEPIDNGSRLQPYWREWCDMGEFLRDERGLEEGLEYLIRHKFLDCIHPGSKDEADFASEIRRVFTREQMEPYLKALLRTRQPQELALRRRARLLLWASSFRADAVKDAPNEADDPTRIICFCFP